MRDFWDRAVTPRSKNEDEARREYMTKVLVGIMAIILAVVSIVATMLRSLNTPGFQVLDISIVPTFGFIIIVTVWFYAYRVENGWKLASYIPTSFFLLLSLWSSYKWGIGSTTIIEMSITVLVTALLLGHRTQWMILLILAVGQGVLGFIHEGGLWLNENFLYYLFTNIAFLIFENALLRFMSDQFRKSLDRARELNDLRNRFIRIVSHQLRTPLSAVKWNLEILISGDLGKISTPVLNSLRECYKSENTAINRINDLLIVLDIEEGDSLVEKEEISIVTLFKEVVQRLKSDCGFKKLKCEFDIPTRTIPLVFADAEKIKTVMFQLTRNAVQYTPEGGSIITKLRRKNRFVRFEVTDTGIGIPAESQAKIFDRFFRASNALSVMTDASGIGLFIAKYYIEQHGGMIGFKSEEGKGSTFWFEVPIT